MKTEQHKIDIVSVKLVRESSVHYCVGKIVCPEDAANLIRGLIEDADREILVALYLSTKNEPTAIHTISVGTINESPVHPREVFKGAILANAAAIILAHNHPSGDPTPSDMDVQITNKLVKAGEMLGIKVLDHVIIVNGRFNSLKSMGLILN